MDMNLKKEHDNGALLLFKNISLFLDKASKFVQLRWYPFNVDRRRVNIPES